MKKLFLSLLAVSALAVTGYSQTNSSLYNANEFSIGIGTSYNLNNGFNSDYDIDNLDVQVSLYPLNKYLGFTASLPFYTHKDISVREVALGAQLRLPVLKHFAPQVGAGAIYNWNTENFDYQAWAGIEARLNSKWGVLTTVNYRIQDTGRVYFKEGDLSIRAGLVLVF